MSQQQWQPTLQIPLKVFFYLCLSIGILKHTTNNSHEIHKVIYTALSYHSRSHLAFFSFYTTSLNDLAPNTFIQAQLTWKPYRTLPMTIVLRPKPMMSRVASLQDGPRWPLLQPNIHSFCNSLPCCFSVDLYGQWNVREVSDGMWLSRLGYHRHWGFSFSLVSLALGKANWHFVRTAKQLCGEVHVMRNGSLLPTDNKTLSPPTINSVSKLNWEQTLCPLMGKSSEYHNPGKTLTLTSWKMLSKYLKIHSQTPNSSEVRRNDKYLLGFVVRQQ